MAFDPAHITYPIGNLQHMFNRHKEDWGFKDVNWNKVTQEEFKAALVQFIGETDTVYTGTYRQQGAWLVVDHATRKCAIVHRPGYEIWSGWKLSLAQFEHATHPPYSLGGGGASLIFGNILEFITKAETHDTLDLLANQFFEAYKAHGDERFSPETEGTLMDFFGDLDNYLPPNMVAVVTPHAGHIHALDEVKKRANHTLAVLERNA